MRSSVDQGIRRSRAQVALDAFRLAAGNHEAPYSELVHSLRQLVLTRLHVECWMRSLTEGGVDINDQLAVRRSASPARIGAEAWELLMACHAEAALYAGGHLRGGARGTHICEFAGPHAEFAADTPCVKWAWYALEQYNVASGANRRQASVAALLQDLRLLVEHGRNSWATLLAPYYRAPAAVRTYVCTLPQPHGPIVVVAAVQADDTGMLAEARLCATRRCGELGVPADVIGDMVIAVIDGDVAVSVRNARAVVRQRVLAASDEWELELERAGPMTRLPSGVMRIAPHPDCPLDVMVRPVDGQVEVAISTTSATTGDRCPQDYHAKAPARFRVCVDGEVVAEGSFAAG